jgi:hypothetical protein
MKSDSPTSRHQKEQMRDATEVAFSIPLPEWFVEGVTVNDFRELRAIFDRAHGRYMTEDVPVRDAPRVKTPGRTLVGPWPDQPGPRTDR